MAVALVTYALAARLLAIPEWDEIVQRVRRRLGRA
jgi:hypothetical protein